MSRFLFQFFATDFVKTKIRFGTDSGQNDSKTAAELKERKEIIVNKFCRKFMLITFN